VARRDPAFVHGHGACDGGAAGATLEPEADTGLTSAGSSGGAAEKLKKSLTLRRNEEASTARGAGLGPFIRHWNWSAP
jgi:hypothetical protein